MSGRKNYSLASTGSTRGNLIKEKAQLSSPPPFAPRNCIEHAVREWDVQCSRLRRPTPIWTGDSMLALLAPKTADSLRDVRGADTSEIGAYLRILLGKQAEVVRRMDCACSRGDLGGVLRVSRSHVAIRGRKRYLRSVPS